jgi:murein DD-endopeptidase MepM/ murein hydrolase activator NlpD
LYVRQRLLSEPDRYQGRRRVPTPPRSRYVFAVGAAVVGAGVVAIGAGQMPDAKAVNPEVLQDLRNADVDASAIADRADDDRASRGEVRSAPGDVDVRAADAADGWALPLDQYTYASAFGVDFGELHAGIDLAAVEGTPYKAVHAGTVVQAGRFGAYGNAVTVRNDDGTEVVYAHSRSVLVQAGDRVEAGQFIGYVGSTGNSYGVALHLEIHVDGQPVDPITYLLDRGVDIKLQLEPIYAGTPAAS